MEPTTNRETALAAAGAELDRCFKASDENDQDYGMNREAFSATTLALAAAFVVARDLFGDDDRAFGSWLGETGRDNVTRHDREALIKIGRHPRIALNVILLTETRSYRTIWQEIEKRLPREAPPICPSPGADAPISALAANLPSEQEQSADQKNAPRQIDDSPSPRPDTKYKFDKLLGDGYAAILNWRDREERQRGFFRLTNTAGLVAQIAEQKGGKDVVRRFADLLKTGDYGPGHGTKITDVSPRLVFPELPQDWARRLTKKPSPAALADMIKIMPDLKRLVEAYRAATLPTPGAKYEFCINWWRTKGGAEPEPTPAPTSAPAPVVIPNLATTSTTIAPYTQKTIFSGLHKAQLRYIPGKDDKDIIVCGQTIYKAGTESFETFCQIFAAYGLWQMMDGYLRLAQPDVVNRGREYCRWAAYADWAAGDIHKSAFGKALWLIGRAMQDNPDDVFPSSGGRPRHSGPYERGQAA